MECTVGTWEAVHGAKPFTDDRVLQPHLIYSAKADSKKNTSSIKKFSNIKGPKIRFEIQESFWQNALTTR